MASALKKLFIGAVSLIVIAYALNLLVDNPYTHSLVRYAINEKLEKNTPLKVDYKSISVSLIPLKADLFSFSLYNQDDLKKPLLSASKTSARLSLIDLIWGEFVLARVELTGLAVDLRSGWLTRLMQSFTEKGPHRPDSASKPAWPPEFKLPIKEFALIDASFLHDVNLGQDDAIKLALNGIDLELEHSSWSDMTLRMEIGQATATRNSIPFVTAGLVKLDAAWIHKSLVVEKFSVLSERENLAGDARLDIVTRPLQPGRGAVNIVGLRNAEEIIAVEGRAAAAGHGDLSMLGASLDIPQTGGRVDIEKASLKWAIPVAADQSFSINVDATGKSSGATIYDFSLMDSRAVLNVTEKGIRFLDLDLRTGEEIHGKGKGFINFDDALTMGFTARLESIRLTQLLSALTVKDFSVLDFAMETPELKIDATGFPFAMKVSAPVVISEFAVPLLDLTPANAGGKSPACSFAVNLDIDAERLLFNKNQGTCAPARTPASPGQPSNLTIAGPIRFGPEGMDLRIDGDLELGLANYFLRRELGGRGRLETRIHGPYEDLLIDIGATLERGRLAGIELGKVDAAVVVAATPQTLTWREISVDGPNIKARSQGRMAFTGDFPLTTKTLIQAADESFASGLFNNLIGMDFPLSFRMGKSEIEFDGFARRPLHAEASINLSLGQVAYGGHSLADEVSLQAKARERDWTVQKLDWELPGLRLEATGKHRSACAASKSPRRGVTGASATLLGLGLCAGDQLAFDAKVKGRTAGNGKEREKGAMLHLQGLPWIGKYFRAIQTDGRPDIDINLRGTLETPELTVEGTIERLKAFSTPVAPLTLRCFMKEGRFSGLLTQKGDSFVGKMEIDLTDDKLPYSWFFTFKRFDLRALGGQALAADPRNYAYLTGSWEWKGQLTEWWESEGKISIDEIWLNYVGEIAGQSRNLNLQLSEQLTLVSDGKQWDFLQGESIDLDSDLVRISVVPKDLRPPGRIGLTADAYIDLRVIALVSDLFESTSGKVHMRLELTGSVEDPELKVTLRDVKKNRFNAGTWEPLAIGIADLRPPLQDIEFEATFADGVLAIERFKAMKGTGTLTAGGTLDFSREDDVAANINASFDDIKLIYPVAVFKSFESHASGQLSLSGSGIPYSLKGDVAVTRARSTRDFDIRSEIIDALRRRKFTKTGTVEDHVLELDVNVSANESIQITNRNVQAVLSADIRVVGNDQRPVVYGQVDVVSGKIIYKREFELTRGIVTFNDPLKPDPTLDILAMADISPYRVYLSVTGKASDPDADMSVEPATRPDGTPITKIDIVTLISRGRLPDTSNVAQDTSGDAVSSEVFNIFVSQFEEPVEKILSLSGQDVVNQVYLESYTSDEDGSQGLRFSLPFNLTQDWDLVLRNDVPLSSSASTKWSVTSEYSLTDNVFLQGNMDRATQKEGAENVQVGGSVDLKFRFGFQ